MRESTSGLAYCRRGDGIPVVLVHGIPGASRAWAGVADRVVHGDIIVPDLLGFGASAVPRPLRADFVGPTAQATALESLLDELGVGGAVLAGHDYGVPIVTLLAARRPDLCAAAVLLAGNTFADTPIPFPLSLTTLPVVGPLAARALFSAPSLRLMLRQGTAPGSRSPDPDVYLGSASQRAAIATIFSAALANLRELYAPVEAALRALDTPVIVGWGDRDPFFPIAQAERTASAAGGELRVFDGAGHFLPHERADDVAELIDKAIAAVS